MTTFTEARDQIYALLKAAWDPTTYKMLYEDVQGELPTTVVPWARAAIRRGASAQTALIGGSGKNKFTRTGAVIVQIFTPCGEGLSSSDILAKIIVDAFEGKSTAGGIWFRSVTVNDVGADGNYYQVNISVQFEYDELK